MAPTAVLAAESIRSDLLEGLNLISPSEKVDAALANATEGRVP